MLAYSALRVVVLLHLNLTFGCEMLVSTIDLIARKGDGGAHLTSAATTGDAAGFPAF